MSYNNLKIQEHTTNHIDVAEEGKHYVLSFADGRHIKVTALAEQIIHKFDGIKSNEQICAELNEEGVEISTGELEQFIEAYLCKHKIIDDRSPNRRMNVAVDKGRLWFHLPLVKGDKIFFLLRPFRFLYRKAAAVSALAALTGINLFLFLAGYYNGLGEVNIYEFNSIAILAILYLSFVFHELGHAAAASYYNIKVGDMGIGLYLFRPVFYTDMSKAWILDRKKRIITDLGGIYFQALFILILSFVLLFFNSLTLKISVIFIFASILGNINPVLRYDGYWIITDLLGIVNINKRAFAWFKQVITSFFKTGKPNLTSDYMIRKAVRPIFYGYIAVYSLFTVAFLFLGVFLVVQVAVNPRLITEPFIQLAGAFMTHDVQLILKKLNNCLIFFIPLLYLGMLIIPTLSRLLKKKKR